MGKANDWRLAASAMLLILTGCRVEAKGPSQDAKDARCGGSSGNKCGPREYCAFEPGQECGAKGATATCKPSPEVCTEEFRPVCGCDGKQHDNACSASRAGTGILKAAPCQ